MRLYVVAASHPGYAVEAALRLKGLSYDRVVLPIGLSAPFQLARFGRRTVPGLVTDEGYRVMGSRGLKGVKSFIAARACGNKRRRPPAT